MCSVAGTKRGDVLEWDVMDEDNVRRLIRIMDEQNSDPRERDAPAGAESPRAARPSTSSTVPMPSETEAKPTDSSPVVRRNDVDAEEVVAPQPRTSSSPAPGNAESVILSPRVATVIDPSNIREVSRDGSEASLIGIHVLGGDSTTVAAVEEAAAEAVCTCRPDMMGATSETEWIAVKCCSYNRQQRVERQEREAQRLRFEAEERAVAGPSCRPDGHKCPSVNEKRKKNKGRHQSKAGEGTKEKKTKRDDYEGLEDAFGIDFESLASELNENEGAYTQNKDDPTVKRLMGWTESDEDSSSS